MAHYLNCIDYVRINNNIIYLEGYQRIQQRDIFSKRDKSIFVDFDILADSFYVSRMNSDTQEEDKFIFPKN